MGAAVTGALFTKTLQQFCVGVAIATALAVIKPAAATDAQSASAPTNAPVIREYRQDPMPIYDISGPQPREIGKIPVAQLPPLGPNGLKIVHSLRQGFVGIEVNNKLVWLRKFSVDVVGDVNDKSIVCPCVPKGIEVAEATSLEQGLGCPKAQACPK